jgi:N-acetylglucosamine kinase-like BadF-type ATPase
VAGIDGEILGLGRAGGANIWSSGTSVSQVLVSAVGAALGDEDPRRVVGAVVAIAGSLTGEDVAAEVAASWRSLRIPATPDVVSDALAGYATATSVADGTVLVGGTGSIAAAIRDRRVSRTAGGYGWMLGDEGSAVWLGREGIRAALRALDHRGPDSLLATTIPEALRISASSDAPMQVSIIRAVHARPPARLGLLAPIVVGAATEGDPVAQALMDAATEHLVGLVEAVIGDRGGQVIVLTGSLLTEAAPIGRSVRARLAERWPLALLSEARSGEAGAAALAIERYAGRVVDEGTLGRLREARST